MVQFSYAPAFKDFLCLNRYVLRPFLKKMLPFGIFLFALFCLLAAKQFLSQGPVEWKHLLFSTPLLLPGALTVFFRFFVSFAAKKRWEAAEVLREERQFWIDDTGIRMEASSVSGFTEWKNISEADAYEGMLLFKTFQNQFYFFPANKVPEKRQFIELAKTKVKTSREFDSFA